MRDVIIVGGGPAGLAVAIGAARAGLDAVVCERRLGVIDKACGEGLMPVAIRALARLGVDPDGFPIHGIRYRHESTLATAPFRGGYGRGVRRTTLHLALRTAAERAGITILEQPITDIEQHQDHVVAAGLRGRWLVAADGLHSPIRNTLGLSAPARSAKRWGQRRHYALTPGSDFVDVHWARHGEAYVTPVSGDTVGVAVLSSVRLPFEEQLAWFPELAEQLNAAEPLTAVRGAGPLMQCTRGRVAGRVLLVGDAAGYVDALTGEGIAVALATAAELVSCLIAGNPAGYEAAWRRVSRRTRLMTSGLLWARQHTPLERLVVPLASRIPPLFTATVNALAN